MSDKPFKPTDATATEWADVRMTDPDHGEWDVDVVVAAGRVEYVDLRLKPELLAGFVDCLLDDVDTDRARSVLETVADRQGIEFGPEETVE